MHPPQEPDSLSWKWITGVSAGTIALTIVLSVVAAFAVLGYRASYGGQRVRDLDRPYRGLPANTELEYHLFEESPGEGQRMRAAERARLDSFGWTNREAEVLRIPIDEAMELVVEGQP